MSQTALNMYLNHLQHKKHEDLIRRQASLTDWYERQRNLEKQAEIAKQKELDEQRIFARESFFSNLDTRRLDLQHSIALYPLAYSVTIDWWKHCGCNKFLGKIAAAGMDYQGLLSNRSRIDLDVDYIAQNNERYRAYNHIGAMCNDLNPQYQYRIMAAVALFFKHFPVENFDASLLNLINGNRASKISHLVMGFMGLFSIIGERSSAQPFELFWSLSKEQRDSLLSLKSTEGELFRVFCPNDPSLADDLIRMRELFTLAKYALPNSETFNRATPKTDQLTQGLLSVLSVDDYLDDQFDSNQKLVVEKGVTGLIKCISVVSMDVDDFFYAMKLHEQFPLIYSTTLSLLLLSRINAACFYDAAKCFMEPDNLNSPVASSALESVIGITRYFPEMEMSENHEVWLAATSCNLIKQAPTTARGDSGQAHLVPKHAKGHIIPSCKLFTQYEIMISLGVGLNELEIDCDLMPFVVTSSQEDESLSNDDINELMNSLSDEFHLIDIKGEHNV